MNTNLLILVNENLHDAELAFNQATVETIVQRCREYLSLLSAYREKLYKLRGTPEICLHQPSMVARELVEQTRKAIRTSLEVTTKERNKIEALLKSFTSISGYEAADTFNRLKYRGLENWERKAGGIRSNNDTDDTLFSIQEAVDIAGNLRRDAYIAHKITF